MLASSCGVLRPGDVLDGKYVVRDCIGEGGMSSVFLADQPALARQVAIKVLRADLAASPRHAQRIHDEAVAACHVRNPHSLAVIDCNVTPDGVTYLVMQHIPGTALRQLIGDDLRLPRALDLFTQVLRALGAVHESGVIHGDIKSDNFLVEDLDGRDHVTLIDFGLARLARQGLRAEPGESEAIISGTPAYMAPEVIRGEAPSFASDLYSAGVLLYELLTGALPFSGATTTELLLHHLRDEVVLPSVRRPDRRISAALDRVVMRALAKRPDARFADAASFARELGLAASTVDECSDAAAPALGHAPAPDEPCDERGAGAGSISKRYLALADAYLQVRDRVAAARVLQEGINVLRARDDAASASASASAAIDHLVIALIALYDELGAEQVAREMAIETDRSPTLVCPL
ncbi:MAG TPA: serine/threonine-protein kinase [Kofleriaceae bacterium]|nr:serine/threonine-protein kinase [Kofleriaceae bacterium]